MASNAHLSIGTATDRIDLLNPRGLHENGWKPKETPVEDYWSESALAELRSLVHYRHKNAVETIPLILKKSGQDLAILELRQLRNMLLKARRYWATNWQNEIVYLAAQQSCESERRYAWIQRGEVPEDDAAFGHLFKKGVMRDISLVVERGPWMGNPPGEGTCIPVGGYALFEERAFGVGIGQEGDGLFYLRFNAADDVMNCGSHFAVDDLPTADFCVDGWVRAFSPGGGGYGRIVDKGLVSQLEGWHFGIQPNGCLEAEAVFETQNAWAETYVAIDDGEWHWVAVHFDATDKLFRLYIDGTNYTQSLTRILGSGAYVTAATRDLKFGNSAIPANERGWDGDFGWLRLSDVFRYSGGSRCTCPGVDGGTIGLWCMAEGTGTDVDNAEGTAALDGDLDAEGTPTWGFDCYDTGISVTTETSCDDPVYIANHQKLANLTHVYHYDANLGNWSSNLLDQVLPYDLLPASINTGDAVFFGIEDTGVSTDDGGGFSSLVFYLTEIADITDGDWEYYVGPGWTNCNDVIDNTNAGNHPFERTGIHAVHWTPTEDWMVESLSTIYGGVAPDVYAYWVRCYITATNGTPPEQDERNPYTVSWAFAEINDDQTGGDMPMLGKTRILNRSADTGVREWKRAVCGARCVSRGDEFVAYINWAHEQNSDQITLSYTDPDVTVHEYPPAPGNRVLYMKDAVLDATDTWYTVGSLSIAPPLTRHYQGKFRIFLRAMHWDTYSDAVAENVWVRATITCGNVSSTSRAFAFPDISQLYAFDLGEWALPLGVMMDASDYISEIEFSVEVMAESLATHCEVLFYDLVLIPTDEWCIDLAEGEYGTTDNELMEIDSIDLPRASLRVLLRDGYTDYVRAYASSVAPGPHTWQESGTQRLWCTFFTEDTMPSPAEPDVVNMAELYVMKRYTSMRGDDD